MSAPRLSDAKVNRALRAHLPGDAEASLRERILDEVAATPQMRALPRPLGWLTQQDPRTRRQAILLATLALLALAFAGGAIVGALLDDRQTPFPGASNGWIAFYAPRGVGEEVTGGGLFLVRDGVAPRRVVPGGEIEPRCPAFSPHGSRLAFSEWRGGPDSGTVSIVLRGFDPAGALSGPELRFAVSGSPRLDGPCVEWAPDGRALAYATSDGKLVVATLDGRQTTILSNGDCCLGDFEWSPDGRTIAINTSPGPIDQLWLVPTDGGDPRVLEAGTADDQPGDEQGDQYDDFSTLAWSPDGLSIALAGTTFRNGAGVEAFIRIVDPGGSGHYTLTTDVLDAASGHGIRPAWSNDGTRIAYQQRDGRIVLAARDGSATDVLSLVALPEIANRPIVPDNGLVWSPDGRRLLYVGAPEGSGFTSFVLVSAPTEPSLPPVALTPLTPGPDVPSGVDMTWQPVLP